MPAISSVAVIGAGPYGLSIAAHLRAKGIEALVFGAPMDTWRNGMPRGMKLKSEGFASCLSDPAGRFTLEAFCREQNLPYADLDFAVPVETFTAYGTAFADRFVPRLDRRGVRHLSRIDCPTGAHFRLDLDDGTVVAARRVIVAAGIASYRRVPAVFADLPAARLTHTADHADYSPFAGKRVVVVGAGASAIDAAAALQRAGAAVRLVSRRGAITFHAAGRRRWFDRIAAPLTPLGPGWKKLLCTRAPLLFRLLPERLRASLVRRHLGPAPGWSARADFEGKVEVTLRASVTAARLADRGVEITIAGPEGVRTMEPADHVVVGTGYHVDVAALPFLAPALRAGLDLGNGSPRLSGHFESTVPGLYFAGTAAANTFGPLLRFVCGAGFAARRITAHLAAAAPARRHVLPVSLASLAAAAHVLTLAESRGRHLAIRRRAADGS